MRTRDLLIQPFAALARQKLRTALTTLGVIVSAFVLAASLSAGQGVQETLARETHRIEVARRIQVFSNWKPPATQDELKEIPVDGEMSDARRGRLRQALAEKLSDRRASRRVALTPDRLRRLAEIPHVERLVPSVDFGPQFAVLAGRSVEGFVSSIDPRSPYQNLMVAGRFVASPSERGVVIGEAAAYQLGARNEADVAALVGKTLRLELRSRWTENGFRVFLNGGEKTLGREGVAALEKIQARLPLALDHLGLAPAELAALKEVLAAKPPEEPEVHDVDLPIVGVFRSPTPEEDRVLSRMDRTSSEILIPYETARDAYFEWLGRTPGASVNMAVIQVDDEANVKAVLAKVREQGLDGNAAIEFIDRQRLIYLLIFGGMTCVAGAAMIVAAIGIANTLVMSVLERTREIGIMKAVGADDRDLMFLFLAEGATIGLIGGASGLLLAWAASFPADAWVQGMVRRDLDFELGERIFVFPPWLVAVVLIAPLVVTILAAAYPARRAARVDPVTALRHE